MMDSDRGTGFFLFFIFFYIFLLVIRLPSFLFLFLFLLAPIYSSKIVLAFRWMTVRGNWQLSQSWRTVVVGHCSIMSALVCVVCVGALTDSTLVRLTATDPPPPTPPRPPYLCCDREYASETYPYNIANREWKCIKNIKEEAYRCVMFGLQHSDNFIFSSQRAVVIRFKRKAV